MTKLFTAKIIGTGQITIPEEKRNELFLKMGDSVRVYVEKINLEELK